MSTLTRSVSAVAFLRVPLYPYPRTHTHVTAEILPVVLPVVLAEGPVHDGEVHHGIMVWHHGRVRGDGQVDIGHDSRLWLVMLSFATLGCLHRKIFYLSDTKRSGGIYISVARNPKSKHDGIVQAFWPQMTFFSRSKVRFTIMDR